MRIEQLKYLIAVAENGSINKAAQSLYVSYQSLLAAINSFEAEIGHKVIVRTAHGTYLTEAGKQIVEESRDIVLKTQGWLNPNFGQENNDIEINIACTALIREMLDTIILQTRKKYPQVKFRLIEVSSNSRLLAAAEKKSNIILMAVDEEKRKKLIRLYGKLDKIEQLGVDCLQVIFSSNNNLKDNKKIEQDQLYNYKWAVYSASDFLFNLDDELKKYIKNNTVYDSDDKKQMLEVVANSDDVIAFGVVLDTYCSENFQSEKLLMRSVELKDKKSKDIMREHNEKR